jgi:dTDP-4-amino-4,6-dideoxygalactose transaminase
MNDQVRIPFNRATYGEPVRAAVNRSLDSPKTSGDGSFSEACHEFFESALDLQRALLTTSCTHALEMTALLLDLQPGDEVIVPSFTFVSTANAFALRGVKVVFADIDERTLNIDVASVGEKITSRTRAIVVVHYAGVACEMNALSAVAKEHDVCLVEDNAHGLFGKFEGRWLGTIGTFGTQSFHETKNFYCGEGGALFINDQNYTERAEIVREKGTNRKKFFRGEIDKYSWVDIGSSYLLSDINAAVLYPQLQSWRDVQDARAKIWNTYQTELRSWATRHGVRQPHIPPYCEQAYHLYYLRFSDADTRSRFLKHMRRAGILAVFHYLPLHLSSYGRRYGGEEGDCPVTEHVSETLVRLPLYKALTDNEVQYIVDTVLSFVP